MYVFIYLNFIPFRRYNTFTLLHFLSFALYIRIYKKIAEKILSFKTKDNITLK